VAGGYDLKCFPLNMRIKTISNEVKYWYDKLGDVKSNLNYPRFSDELENRWIKMCENKDDEVIIQELYDSLSDFCNEVIKKANDNVEVNGIKIFR